MAGRLGDVSVRYNLYRNTSRGKIAGVCAGLGDRLGIRPNWIRLGFILAAVSVFHAIPAVLIYLALAIVMRPAAAPIGYVVMEEPRRSGREPGYDGVAPLAGGPAPVWTPPGSRLGELRTRFTAIDARLSRIEAIVTSDELSLRRKFRDLGG